MEKLNNIVQMSKDFHERMKNEGSAALKEAFAEFFAGHPEVEAIVWRQYTPYFNDGEACTFSRHDFAFVGQEDPKNSSCSPSDDNCLKSTLWQIDYYKNTPHGRELTAVEQAQLEAYKTFERVCSQVDELFETVFGDHVQVRATRQGFDVEDIDHD